MSADTGQPTASLCCSNRQRSPSSAGSGRTPIGTRCAAQWRALSEGLAQLLFPIACVVCGDLIGGSGGGRGDEQGEPSLVCPACWSKARPLPHPRCERCGHPVPALELAELRLAGDDVPATGLKCTWCALLPPYVRAARSVCWVNAGTGADLVHALKYGGWTRLARQLATPMARVSWPLDVVEERRALIPVPLAPVKLRERGFNQSQLLAESIARVWSLEVWNDVLRRARHTRTQTRLTPGEREANVAGAFEVDASGRARIRGKHLLLIDDVVTTCATLNACTTALFDAGARVISYLTFGRAPAAADR